MVSVTKLLLVVGLVTFGQAQIPSFFDNEGNAESICNTDESLNVVCYKDSEPAKVSKSLAVARLLIGGSWCTGWLFGSEGHLITNNHCINNDAAAANTRVEFASVTPGCQDSVSLGSNPGVYATTNVTLILNDVNLDFALVKLNLVDGFDLKPYGYLQASETTVNVNDTAYVMGHPYGKPRRIAMVKDGTTAGRITTTNYTEPVQTNCYNVDRLGHNLDTEGGSSGSPLMSATTNLVIGLHNCGGCKASTTAYGSNYAIKMTYIVNLLRVKNVLPKDSVVATLRGTQTQALTVAPTFAPSPSKCTVVEENVAYFGYHLASTQRSEVSLCCGDCDITPGCKLFVWTTDNGGTCWLKSDVGTKVASVGVKSAVLANPMATASPPTPPRCSPIEVNKDFYGEDIAAIPGPLESCCVACESMDKCNAFSWFNDICYLKGKRTSPSLTSGVYSSRVYKCSAVESGVDYFGADIGSAFADAVEDCCAVCRSTADCKAFSFAFGVCYLKSSKGIAKPNSVVASAVL